MKIIIKINLQIDICFLEIANSPDGWEKNKQNRSNKVHEMTYHISSNNSPGSDYFHTYLCPRSYMRKGVNRGSKKEGY
jgi:hypothetical protein